MNTNDDKVKWNGIIAKYYIITLFIGCWLEVETEATIVFSFSVTLIIVAWVKWLYVLLMIVPTKVFPSCIICCVVIDSAICAFVGRGHCKVLTLVYCVKVDVRMTGRRLIEHALHFTLLAWPNIDWNNLEISRRLHSTLFCSYSSCGTTPGLDGRC